ncbi:MAG: hypothetical protein WKF40_07720 [Thermoleophilaceae bacterium]
MSATDYGWLVLALPLAGTVLIMLGWLRLPGRLPGWIASATIGGSFLASIGMLLRLLDEPEEGRSLVGIGLLLHRHRRLLGRPVDPGRSPVGGHVPGGVGGLVPDPPLLGLLHDLGPRLHALLRLPQLLRLLDAAADPGGQLRAADRGLGLRGRCLLPADLLLVPAHHGHRRRHQGVRDQRDR